MLDLTYNVKTTAKNNLEPLQRIKGWHTNRIWKNTHSSKNHMPHSPWLFRKGKAGILLNVFQSGRCKITIYLVRSVIQKYFEILREAGIPYFSRSNILSSMLLLFDTVSNTLFSCSYIFISLLLCITKVHVTVNSIFIEITITGWKEI